MAIPPRYGLSQTSAPAVEPITLQETKDFLRVDTADDDALLDAMIVAVRDDAERKLRRALVTQTWEYTVDRFPDGADPILLPRPPLSSVTSVQYWDTASTPVEQTWAASNYSVDTTRWPGRVQPVDGTFWPAEDARLNAVTVTFVAGYGNPVDVPGMIRQTMLVVLNTLYEHRESMVVGTVAAKLADLDTDALYRPYRAARFR